MYQAALAAGVASAALWSNLGVLRASLGEDDAALACYQQALALEPSHASAQFNQAYVYLRRGDYARGWAALEARLVLLRWRANCRGRAGKAKRWPGGRC